MTIIRHLSLLALAAVALVSPASAQFAVSIQQNGQAAGVANGGSINLNAPVVGQPVSASITVTYLGNGTAVFPSAGQIFGSKFSVSAGVASTSLLPLQSRTFNIQYTPTDSAQAVGQFFWPFNEVDATGKVFNTGAISLNIIGTAPNVIIGQVSASGSFLTVANGGIIQFPDTLLNNPATLTIAVVNAGSGPGTVNSILASGEGFQLKGVPVLPLTLNPGTQSNITAQFQPATPGRKQVRFRSPSPAAISPQLWRAME